MSQRSEPPGAPPLEMAPEEMRRLGYAAVDAVVERLEGLRDTEPWRGARREELEPRFGGPAPEGGSPATEVMHRAVAEILPRAGRIDHPRFFAFVPSSPTWPSIVARILTAGYNVFEGTWLGAGGPSQIELVVVDWFRAWVGMPPGAGGLFTSGGSAANLGALVAARETCEDASRAVVYVGDQGHSSLERAARIAGIPADRLRTVPTDDAFRLDVGALDEAVARDRAAGLLPLCVCANAGATNTGATDPLHPLADLCAERRLWLHVDAAYGGFAVLTERGRRAMEGIERADSVTLDPHKWLFQPYESGCLLVRDVGRLEAAFRVFPEYLQDTRLGLEHVNFADRGLQLSRSFRALDVWMSVETHGLAAFRRAIDESLDLAEEAGRWIRDSEGLEILSPPTLGVVCFRYRPDGDGDEGDLERLNAAIQERVVAEGTAMMSSTRLRGTYSLRLCILNYRSRWEDVESTLVRIRDLGRTLSAP